MDNIRRLPLRVIAVDALIMLYAVTCLFHATLALSLLPSHKSARYIARAICRGLLFRALICRYAPLFSPLYAADAMFHTPY